MKVIVTKATNTTEIACQCKKERIKIQKHNQQSTSLVFHLSFKQAVGTKYQGRGPQRSQAKMSTESQTVHLSSASHWLAKLRLGTNQFFAEPWMYFNIFFHERSNFYHVQLLKKKTTNHNNFVSAKLTKLCFKKSTLMQGFFFLRERLIIFGCNNNFKILYWFYF